MTHLVTFCTFDSTVEGNPAWHGAFILSKLNEEKKLVEVFDTWGFYGVPATGDRNHWFTRLKRSLGLDVDFFGNHGWLVHEEVRYMDLGHGLHGYSYELSEEQFNQLQTECLKRVADQEAAVHDAVQKKGFKKTSTAKIRHYPQEEFSREIFQIEREDAQNNHRESRLKPFDLALSRAGFRPSLKGSHTCKSEALEILATVLSAEQLAPYRTSTFPRFVSGNMEDILLHSEGEVVEHLKASKERIYFRARTTPGVKLIWSVPPQKIDALPDSNTQANFAVDPEYSLEVKAIVSKLQRLDWLLRNAQVPEQYQEYQHRLVERVVACYCAFEVIEPETKTSKVSGLSGFAYSLFSWPKNKEQANLMTRINAAKDLFNSLYMAIVSGWEIDDALLPERAILPTMPVNKGNDEELHPAENALEALAAYLGVDTQKKLCKIIGRTYCAPELELAEDLPRALEPR